MQVLSRRIRSLLLLTVVIFSSAPAFAEDGDADARYAVPAEPAHAVRTIRRADVRAAREAGVDVFTHLFGEAAANVARFNRLDPKFAWAGRRVRVPELSTDARYTPLPAAYRPAERHAKLILVALDAQFVGVYENGLLTASYPASTGDDEHRTPVGRTRVTAKDEDHASSIYPEPTGGWPMPWAVRFRGTAYWIHEGDLPGRPASHGCVRLLPGDAQELFDRAEIGTVVHVVKALPNAS